MNEIKKAYELYKKKLRKELNLKLKQVIAISSKKPSKDNLTLENEILKEIIDTFYSYTKVLEAQNNEPSSAGRKRNKANEIEMHKALEDCIRKLDGIYPSLKQFLAHWDSPNYLLPNPENARNINLDVTGAYNGIGYEKLKKFVKTYRDKQIRRTKLLELGIIDLMAPTKTQLSELLKLK
jgi:hypothetical protein